MPLSIDAIVEKDNFAFLAIGRPETKGCYCRINSYLKSVIETVGNQFDYIVIDCEAGIEQVNRRVIEEVTHLLLVSDASRKGIEVIKSISKVASEAVKYDKMACIFNRIEDESLLENVDLDGLECIGVVKSDKEIARFDAVAKDFMLIHRLSGKFQDRKTFLQSQAQCRKSPGKASDFREPPRAYHRHPNMGTGAGASQTAQTPKPL